VRLLEMRMTDPYRVPLVNAPEVSW
jgi:hypothetical protein